MPTRYPSRRSVVMGFQGAVASSQSLAVLAGMRMLLAGGNAADAAVAVAAALNVVEPMKTGVGGDAFVLVYWAKDRKVYALNASGRAPYAATLEEIRRRGHDKMPDRGILPVTVPGTVAGWADLLKRFGTMGLDRVLTPAIDYATSGFPVSELVVRDWTTPEAVLRQRPETARVFLPGGRVPRPGQRVTFPDLAQTLRTIAENGPDGFYRGRIAEAIVRCSQENDGLLSLEDLADHTSTWCDPIYTDYRGYRVYECPPNGQGIAALIALNILSGYDLSAMGYESPEAFHVKMEAIKLGLTDAARYVADPEMAEVPVKTLLSAAYADQRRAAISMDGVVAEPQPGEVLSSPDTVYLTAADGEGNAVSLINSLYMDFGSGITVPGTGILLQNRGNLFSLDPQHPNCIAPHKRPYHTIIPSMITRDDALVASFGVMGGFMQPQGHVQVVSNVFDHGMDVQQALDAPRFMWSKGDRFSLQSNLPEETYAALRRLGHDIIVTEDKGFGGAQIIRVDPESGAYLCGSEPYKDGCALAY